VTTQDVKQGLLHGLEAALVLADRQKAAELLTAIEELPVGLRPPYLAAIGHRFRAQLAGDDATAQRDFAASASELRRIELPFHLAVVLLEHGEWLLARRRGGEAAALLAEARETFEHLRAQPWLERLDAAEASAPSEVSV
jgi:hypothetical protein